MQEGAQGGGREADTTQLWNLVVRTPLWLRDLGLKPLPCPSTEAAMRGIFFSTFCSSSIQCCACAHEVSSLHLIEDTAQVEASPFSTKDAQRWRTTSPSLLDLLLTCSKGVFSSPYSSAALSSATSFCMNKILGISEGFSTWTRIPWKWTRAIWDFNSIFFPRNLPSIEDYHDLLK